MPPRDGARGILHRSRPALRSWPQCAPCRRADRPGGSPRALPPARRSRTPRRKPAAAALARHLGRPAMSSAMRPMGVAFADGRRQLDRRQRGVCKILRRRRRAGRAALSPTWWSRPIAPRVIALIARRRKAGDDVGSASNCAPAGQGDTHGRAVCQPDERADG